MQLATTNNIIENWIFPQNSFITIILSEWTENNEMGWNPELDTAVFQEKRFIDKIKPQIKNWSGLSILAT